VSVARGYLFHVLNAALAEVVNWKEISQLAHPVGFTANRQKGLPEAQIGDRLGQPETQLRLIQINRFL
jgi:hypothetical protein